MQWFEGHAEALTKLGICTFPKCLLAMLGADTLLAQSQSNAFPSQQFRSMLEFLWLIQEFNGGYSPGSPWSSPGVECAVHWDPGRFPGGHCREALWGGGIGLCSSEPLQRPGGMEVLLLWSCILELCLEFWNQAGPSLASASGSNLHHQHSWVCGRIPSQPGCGYLKLKLFLFWCRFLRAQLRHWF